MTNETDNTTTTMSKDITRLKILAFHGYRQNGDTFKAKLGSFRKATNKYAHITFITAPHKVQPEENDEAKEKEEDQRGWWFNAEDNSFSGKRIGGPAIGFEKTLNHIEEVVNEHGPFDGFLGFSQGACLVGILSAMQQKGYLKYSFKFAILVSGFCSGSLFHKGFYDDDISIPSLHVYGENDLIIPKDLSENLLKNFTNHCIIKHHRGHIVPNTKRCHLAYKDFLCDIIVDKHVEHLPMRLDEPIPLEEDTTENDANVGDSANLNQSIDVEDNMSERSVIYVPTVENIKEIDLLCIEDSSSDNSDIVISNSDTSRSIPVLSHRNTSTPQLPQNVYYNYRKRYNPNPQYRNPQFIRGRIYNRYINDYNVPHEVAMRIAYAPRLPQLRPAEYEAYINRFQRNHHTNRFLGNHMQNVERKFVDKRLEVAIVNTTPIRRVEFEQIKQAILSAILQSSRGVVFHEIYLKAGWIQVNCASSETKKWLNQIVPTLKPWATAELSVLTDSYEKIAKCKIPNCKVSADDILVLIEKQNPGLWTVHWRLIYMEKVGNVANVVFGIDPASMGFLTKTKFSIFVALSKVVLEIVSIKKKKIKGTKVDEVLFNYRESVTVADEKTKIESTVPPPIPLIKIKDE